MDLLTVINAHQTQLMSLSLIAIMMAISPGADFALVTRNSLSAGRLAGLLTSVGITVGCIFHLAYCVTGLVFIINNSPLASSVIKYLGAAYLIYLGYQSFRTKPQPNQSEHIDENNEFQLSPFQAFMSGLMSNVLNPKTSLFFLSIFSQLVTATTPISMQLLYGLIILLAHILWFSFLSLLLTNRALRLKLENKKLLIDRTLGVVLMMFGLNVLWL